MPAAMQRSRSPVMACAVIAMIRVWPPSIASRSRIAAVASRPPISGICTSISTRSKRSRATISRASRPLFATVTEWPAAGQQPDRDALVDDVVFGQEDLRRTDVGRGRRRPVPTAALLHAVFQHTADLGQQLGLPHGLGQIRRDPQLAAASRIAVLSRRGQHHDRRVRQLRPGGHLRRRRRSRRGRACWRRAARARTASPSPTPRAALRAPPGRHRRSSASCSTASTARGRSGG